jgi:hypothetical protein
MVCENKVSQLFLYCKYFRQNLEIWLFIVIYKITQLVLRWNRNLVVSGGTTLVFQSFKVAYAFSLPHKLSFLTHSFCTVLKIIMLLTIPLIPSVLMLFVSCEKKTVHKYGVTTPRHYIFMYMLKGVSCSKKQDWKSASFFPRIWCINDDTRQGRTWWMVHFSTRWRVSTA